MSLPQSSAGSEEKTFPCGEVVDPRGFEAVLYTDGRVPEAFIRHYEATGEIDGRLWPIRWPVQRVERPAWVDPTE